MAHNNAVIVVGGYLGKEFLAVLGHKVFLCRGKNLSCRIGLGKLFRYLADRRLQGDNHRLLGNAHAAHLHDGTLHNKGLTGTDNVVNNATTVVQQHPHCGLLMGTQSHTLQAYRLKKWSTPLTDNGAVELLVVHLA